jgi:hypothetical protein
MGQYLEIKIQTIMEQFGEMRRQTLMGQFCEIEGNVNGTALRNETTHIQ